MTCYFRNNRRLFFTVLFVLFYLALLCGAIFWTVEYTRGNVDAGTFRHRALYAVLCAALLALILVLPRVFRFSCPLVLQTALLCFVFLALGGGTVFAFYQLIPHFDKILHTLSGPLFTAVGLSLAFPLVKERTGRTRAWYAVLFAILFSLSVGYVWEIYEFTVDTLFQSNLQGWSQGLLNAMPDGTYLHTTARGTALLDTLYDMILNLLGTLAFSLPAFFLFCKKPNALDAFAFSRKQKRDE